MADKREWSTSQVIENICKQYFKNKTGDEPSTKEVIIDFFERLETGIQESLYYKENKFSEDVLKCLNGTKEDMLNEYS